MTTWLSVLVHTPAHSVLGSVLTYRHPSPLAPGTLVRVPLGARETLGVVWHKDSEEATGELDVGKLRDVAGVIDTVAPLSPHWQQLVRFAAQYYQRSLGEVALAALPPQLRELSPLQMQRRLARAARSAEKAGPPDKRPNASEPMLTPEQTHAVAQIQEQAGPFLLFGATGSGKTEVYLQSVQALLERDPAAQALVMVPEINLTPQLEARFQERFGPLFGAQALVSLHSGMTNPQRLGAWLAAHEGRARIVLGTRMAVFASIPRLALIVVDEEHDPSYKSGEGARYSARDLAIYRGKLEQAKVVLGSATPSLESWYLSRAAEQGGRYLRLHMPSRIGSVAQDLPLVRRVDMNHQARNAIFSLPLLQAIKERVLRGEQCMVFLNRRGYAPVLHCADCGWKSACPHCSAYRVFHKIDRSLRCHHCGFTDRVARACPDCGNPDIAPIGRGTEQIEEVLADLLSDVRRPGTVCAEFPLGEPIRLARIDADTFLFTPYNIDRRELSIGDLVVVRNGHRAAGQTPSRAYTIHSAIYHAHPEINAVVNALPVHASAFCASDARLDTRTIPESYLFLKDVHTIPFDLQYTGTEEIAALIGPKNPVALLQNNGVLVAGLTVLDAFDRLEVLEATATAILRSQSLGQVHAMSDAVIEELMAAFPSMA